MNILDRYFFFEMIAPFFISLLFYSFIFLGNQALKITNMVVNYDIDLFSLCFLILYSIPKFLQYVIPMSIMLSVLTVFLRMSKDNEIIALKANGISIYRFIKPVILFSIIGLLLTGFLTVYYHPKCNLLFESLSRKIVSSSLKVLIKEQFFNDNINGVTVYIGQIGSKNETISDIFIEDSRINGIKTIFVAPEGKVLSYFKDSMFCIRLFDGVVNQIGIDEHCIYHMEFKTYDLCFEVKNWLEKFDLNKLNFKGMNFFELKSLIKLLEYKSDKYYEAIIQYHKMLSIPFSCLPIGILSLGLGIYNNKKRSNTFGVVLSILFFIVYYVFLSIGIFLTNIGICFPFIGLWFPNFFTGVIGLFFLIYSAN